MEASSEKNPHYDTDDPASLARGWCVSLTCACCPLRPHRLAMRLLDRGSCLLQAFCSVVLTPWSLHASLPALDVCLDAIRWRNERRFTMYTVVRQYSGQGASQLF